jgi:ribosome silencing factor RsfS/YbeB/iojap
MPNPPRPARAPETPRQKTEPARLDRLVEAAQRSLEDDKAEDVRVLDVTGRADYADRLVIATGLADRQIQAMATHLEEAFEKEGLRLRRDAIQASPDWVLIDAGDLVVHLFRPDARAMYALERMWGPESPGGEGEPPLVNPVGPELSAEDFEDVIGEEDDAQGFDDAAGEGGSLGDIGGADEDLGVDEDEEDEDDEGR